MPPGAPSLRGEIERRFGKANCNRDNKRESGKAVGVSSARQYRWFRYRGGMPLFMSNHISGSIAFAEREEIGLLRAQVLACVIARRLELSPSTISREPPQCCHR